MKVPTEFKAQSQQMEVDSTFLKVDEEAGRISFPRALIAASMWVNTGRTTFKTSTEAGLMLGDRWDSHPDNAIVLNWLSRKGAPSDFYVLYFVSVHVLTEWITLPKRTVKEHRKLFVQIEKASQELSELLSQTEELYYRGGGYGLRHALVCDLFTDREAESIVAAVQNWNETHPEVMQDGSEMVMDPRSQFPDMEDLLQRLATAAQRIAKAGPIHSQPSKRGALNGFFVRRMNGLLRLRYGEAPTEVLAAISTIAINEAIDRELVAKLLR